MKPGKKVLQFKVVVFNILITIKQNSLMKKQESRIRCRVAISLSVVLGNAYNMHVQGLPKTAQPQMRLGTKSDIQNRLHRT